MRIGILICIAAILTGCGGPTKRNKWQRSEDFVDRRNIYYNDFVQSGGMMKDETSDQITPMKKQIRNAFNQGQTINHIS